MSLSAVVLALALSATSRAAAVPYGYVDHDDVLKVGDQVLLDDLCSVTTYLGGNVWVNHTCLETLWHLEGDLSQDFPDCCPLAVSYTRFLDSLDEEHTAQVTYDGDVEVAKRIELTASQVQNEPEVSWCADSDSYYLLMMVSMTREETDWLNAGVHWAVANVPGSDVHKGDDAVRYKQPTVTGLHYIFLVIEQRSKWSLVYLSEAITSNDFLQKANLVAMNEFTLVE